jgi:DNA-binding transcriptional MerR regulator
MSTIIIYEEEIMQELMPIKEVLELLNITRNTLLAWESKNLLKLVRHPVNNRRYYEREQVEKLAKTLDRF